jgi:hypothetical protein
MGASKSGGAASRWLSLVAASQNKKRANLPEVAREPIGDFEIGNW